VANRQAQQELESLLPDDFPDLGRLQQIHSLRGRTPLDYISIGVILLVIAPAALAVAVFVTPDNPADVPIMKGIFGTLAAGLAIGGAVMLVLGLRKRGRWFKSGVYWMLYDDGLVVVADGTPRAYRWADLEVWLRVVVTQVAIGTHHEYILKPVNKRKPLPFPPGGAWSLRKVMATLQERQVGALLPGLLDRIRAGDTVRFGAVNISRTGVSTDDTAWSWDEVKRFEFQYDLGRAIIVLDIHGRSRPKTSVPLSPTTPNLWLFFNVVREICGRVVKGAGRAESYLR
jgi:hypothetical protein